MNWSGTKYIIKTSENGDHCPIGYMHEIFEDTPIPEGYSLFIYGETKMNYVDKFGRYHDRTVDAEGNPSSNNGFYYTGLAKKYGLPVSQACLEYSRKCAEKRIRHRDDLTLFSFTPISRDEILGLVELGFAKELKIGPGEWNFSPYELPKFNLIAFIHQLVLMAIHYKDRNYFWKNKLTQMYRVAFRVPLSDRYYILRKMGKTSLFYKLIHKLDGLIMPEKRSPRLVRHYKQWDDHAAVENYFGKEHVIAKASK
jgi:hypothetical protein